MASSSRATADSTDAIIQHCPPPSYSFSKRLFGKKNIVQRSCLAVWFQSWSWLHYDEGKDALFCYMYMRATKEKKKVSRWSGEPAFVSPSLVKLSAVETARWRSQNGMGIQAMSCILYRFWTGYRRRRECLLAMTSRMRFWSWRHSLFWEKLLSTFSIQSSTQDDWGSYTLAKKVTNFRCFGSLWLHSSVIAVQSTPANK